MQSRTDEAERVKLLIALGEQPGVSAWFSVWQLARIGRPAAEVWGGAPKPAQAPVGQFNRKDCTA
jgi:hypothetical protein